MGLFPSKPSYPFKPIRSIPALVRALQFDVAALVVAAEVDNKNCRTVLPEVRSTRHTFDTKGPLEDQGGVRRTHLASVSVRSAHTQVVDLNEEKPSGSINGTCEVRFRFGWSEELNWPRGKNLTILELTEKGKADSVVLIILWSTVQVCDALPSCIRKACYQYDSGLFYFLYDVKADVRRFQESSLAPDKRKPARGGHLALE